MITDKVSYDLVCSLGGNCAAAFQLGFRGLWAFLDNIVLPYRSRNKICLLSMKVLGKKLRLILEFWRNKDE